MDTQNARLRFKNWLSVWDGSQSGFEAMPFSLESLTIHEAELLHERMYEPYLLEVARCLIGAATYTTGLTQPYSQRHTPAELLACVALRHWLRCGHVRLATTLRRNERLRFIIMADAFAPHERQIRAFAVTLSAENWKEFKGHLTRYNRGLAAFYIDIT
jgi:hypothetical protein